MIILDATTKSLQFELSGSVTTNQPPFFASYIDTTGTTTTPGEQDGTSNNTTAVSVVSSPASSTQRLVKNICIQNADTVAATVTIIYNNNSTLRNVLIASLAVGDQLIYEDGYGWSCLNGNGYVKTTNSSSSGSPGGTSGQVQYNNAGTFGGVANGQLPATNTNDSASAGHVGEYISSFIAQSSGVALTNGTPANLTSISLTAGDWDVYYNTAFYPANTTVFTQVASSTGSTSATIAGNDYSFGSWAGSFTGDGNVNILVTTGLSRISLSGTTTIYAVARANFSTSTCKVYGGLWARRAR